MRDKEAAECKHREAAAATQRNGLLSEHFSGVAKSAKKYGWRVLACRRELENGDCYD